MFISAPFLLIYIIHISCASSLQNFDLAVRMPLGNREIRIILVLLLILLQIMYLSRENVLDKRFSATWDGSLILVYQCTDELGLVQ